MAPELSREIRQHRQTDVPVSGARAERPCVEAHPVVGDGQLEAALGARETEEDSGGARVLDDVAERLLGHPEDQPVERLGRLAAGGQIDLDVDGQPSGTQGTGQIAQGRPPSPAARRLGG